VPRALGDNGLHGGGADVCKSVAVRAEAQAVADYRLARDD